MPEKLIYCPECQSANLDNSVYCCQCGSPILDGVPARIRKTPWIAVIVISLFLSLIMTSVLHFFNSGNGEQQEAVNKGPAEQGEVVSRQRSDDGLLPESWREKDSREEGILRVEQDNTEIDQLTVGKVSIINSDGFIVTKFPAAVVDGSWLALPARACIGGDSWFFQTVNSKLVPVDKGLWGSGDAVGLWQLEGDVKFTGPSLASWNQERPVQHLSFESGQLSEAMTLVPAGVQGEFIYCSLQVALDPGLLIQNGKVVGWTFGDILDGAFMWTLGPGTDLLYTNYVADFYRETFAGGREEQFTKALTGEGETSALRQLQIFTDGFRLPAKLTPEETPGFLKTEFLYPYISKLVSYIMNQGGDHYIATLAEEPMLWEVNNPEMVKNVLVAVRNIYGTESAFNFIEGPGSDLVLSLEKQSKELEKLHLELYLGRIKNLLDEGNTARGWQVYKRALDRFSNYPELHLLAVELALADRDWIEAENLLYQREYPVELRETRMLLADRISELKGQENKIVVRFEAGASEVPVIATVNESLDQNFIVDTGATFVTIPYSAVESLDIEDKVSQDRQDIQTAGGTISAHYVMLSSIELQGWIVSDVKALVIDLPDRPGLGLLGLNYLNRFRLDLQTEKGILTLDPK